MEIKEAIKLLEYHNRWRLGADVPMIRPKVLTEAIETILKDYEEKRMTLKFGF
jgi:hypothetical protein